MNSTVPGTAVLQFHELFGVPADAAPASMEHRVLESFLQEMDELDFDALTPKRGEQPTRKKRKTETTRERSSVNAAPSWKRKKEQLQRLKDEMKVLQSQVDILMVQNSHGAVLQAPLGLPEDQSVRDSPSDCEHWKGVALSARQRCEASKDENERLKTKLKCNKTTFDTVKRVLELVKTKQSEIFTARAISLKAELDTSLYERFVNSAVFDLLDNRTNERLADLDSIFLETCVPAPGPDVDQVHVCRRSNSDKAAALELKRTRIVPYSADRTSEVMWSVMKLGIVSDDQCNIVKRSDDVMISEGFVTHQLEGGGVVEIRSRCLMKRFAIPEGFIVVIEGVSGWHARPVGMEAWRHVTRDSGWGVVHPVAIGASTPNLCQFQTGLHLLANDWGRNAPIVPFKTPSLLSRNVSDVMIPSFRKILKSRHQLVDNVLVDSTL